MGKPLTQNKVRTIERALGSNPWETNVELANRYRVSPNTIARIRKRLGIPSTKPKGLTDAEKAEAKRIECEDFSHQILLWIHENNEGKRRVRPATIANRFGLTVTYVEHLATHYMTPMSSILWPGKVLQVTNADGYRISKDFSPASRKVSLGKRKAANTIRRRDARIQLAVGNEDEKLYAERTLAQCDVEDVEIKIQLREDDRGY